LEKKLEKKKRKEKKLLENAYDNIAAITSSNSPFKKMARTSNLF
jgi:hypothetical protein